jgi:hypothetical protein
MQKLAMGLLLVLCLASGAFAEYANVSFDQKTADALNAKAGYQIVSPDVAYSAHYTPSDTTRSKVDVQALIGGWTLSGTGSISQATSAGGKLSLQRATLFMGDAGILIKSRITMTIVFFNAW